MKIIEKTKISEQEKEKLQKTFYKMNAAKELLDSVVNLSVVNSTTKAYQDAYAEYNYIWNEILYKYFGNKYTSGPYLWSCDFNTNEVIITEN